MTNIVNLTVMKTLAGNNKLTPDASGYYRVVLGAFNTANGSGEVYLFDGVPALLNDTNSIYYKRITSGRLRAESEHPVVPANATRNENLVRNLTISTERAAAHIKEVYIMETDINEGIPGVGNVVLVEGLIKPSGTFGDGLKASLDNPEEDTCFSIRCITRTAMRGITPYKRVLQLITWDWINDPGIKHASKLSGPKVEAVSTESYDLDNIIINPSDNGVSTEAVSAINELNHQVLATDIMSRW